MFLIFKKNNNLNNNKIMKKRIYIISVNDRIYDAIEIKGNDLREIASKIEDLVKKYMKDNYDSNLKIWERISNFRYHTVDSKSGTHYNVKLKSVTLWTEDEINKD